MAAVAGAGAGIRSAGSAIGDPIGSDPIVSRLHMDRPASVVASVFSRKATLAIPDPRCGIRKAITGLHDNVAPAADQ